MGTKFLSRTCVEKTRTGRIYRLDQVGSISHFSGRVETCELEKWPCCLFARIRDEHNKCCGRVVLHNLTPCTRSAEGPAMFPYIGEGRALLPEKLEDGGRAVSDPGATSATKDHTSREKGG